MGSRNLRELIYVLLLVGFVVMSISGLVICKENNEEIEQQQSKENSESWTGWAKDKISEGLGFKSTDDDSAAKQASDSTMDAAKNAKDKITDTATG